jgi:hypothetical protein
MHTVMLYVLQWTLLILPMFFCCLGSKQPYFSILGTLYSFVPQLFLQSPSHSVEVMVYQYDKLFGYGCWMTSIPTMSHMFIFLEYSEFSSWLPWQPIQILQYPKSIQQNIKMWDMVGILVIQQPYPKSLSY